MRKKKGHDHHNQTNYDNDSSDRTSEFDNRRYIGSQSVATPSAKGRGD